jgi:hypothetical protein
VGGGGWSPNWVHSARRPLTGLLYLPRVIVKVENLVEWMAGETEVLGENLPRPLDQTRDWTRAAEVGIQRLTASAMARPIFPCKIQAMFWRLYSWREENSGVNFRMGEDGLRNTGLAGTVALMLECNL